MTAIPNGLFGVIARKNAGGVAKSFAYIGADGKNTSGTETSHAFTLEAGKQYAGFVTARALVPTDVQTDQADTVTIRETLSGGGDSSYGYAFDFTASAVSTSILITSASSTAWRVVGLWEVNGYSYQASANDTAASGSNSLLTSNMTSESGDVALAQGFWNTGSGTGVVSGGLDTINENPVYFRIHQMSSNGNVTGGSPESFRFGMSGYKAGGGLFSLYR